MLRFVVIKLVGNEESFSGTIKNQSEENNKAIKKLVNRIIGEVLETPPPFTFSFMFSRSASWKLNKSVKAILTMGMKCLPCKKGSDWKTRRGVWRCGRRISHRRLQVRPSCSFRHRQWLWKTPKIVFFTAGKFEAIWGDRKTSYLHSFPSMSWKRKSCFSSSSSGRTDKKQNPIVITLSLKHSRPCTEKKSVDLIVWFSLF